MGRLPPLTSGRPVGVRLLRNGDAVRNAHVRAGGGRAPHAPDPGPGCHRAPDRLLGDPSRTEPGHGPSRRRIPGTVLDATSRAHRRHLRHGVARGRPEERPKTSPASCWMPRAARRAHDAHAGQSPGRLPESNQQVYDANPGTAGERCGRARPHHGLTLAPPSRPQLHCCKQNRRSAVVGRPGLEPGTYGLERACVGGAVGSPAALVDRLDTPELGPWSRSPTMPGGHAQKGEAIRRVLRPH
jgi:hypothetical protein